MTISEKLLQRLEALARREQMTPDALLKYLLDDYERWHLEEVETPYEDPDERYNSSKRHVR
jgi:hypothetical protein